MTIVESCTVLIRSKLECITVVKITATNDGLIALDCITGDKQNVVLLYQKEIVDANLMGKIIKLNIKNLIHRTERSREDYYSFYEDNKLIYKGSNLYQFNYKMTHLYSLIFTLSALKFLTIAKAMLRNFALIKSKLEEYTLRHYIIKLVLGSLYDCRQLKRIDFCD